MKDVQTTEQLKEKIRETIEHVKVKDIGVAFSGGVDSSLLAKVSKDIGKNVTLLTVGFLSQRDIEISLEVSESLGLKLLYDIISLEELEESLKKVVAMIKFNRFVRFENCVSFYFVFRLASKYGLRNALSANGLDELFCGYSVYKKCFGDKEATINLMKAFVDTANKDKTETDRIAASFGINYFCPFLSESFVDFTINIPLDYKIKSKCDEVRKHIIRKAALELGVPEAAAMRTKKAFQYSSGIHKAIREIMRKKGFSRKAARVSGFQNETEAFMRSLRE